MFTFSQIFSFIADFYAVILLILAFILFISSEIITQIVCLIGFFFFLSLIALVLGADFLAALFLIIYVGAIAVLFLFIVMLLDIKSTNVDTFWAKILALFVIIISGSFGFYFYFNPLFLVTGDILSQELTKDFKYFDVLFSLYDLVYIKNVDEISNAGVFGLYLFTYYIPYVLIVGFILLVALIGGIVLTLDFSPKASSEIVSRKLSRHSNTISLFK